MSKATKPMGEIWKQQQRAAWIVEGFKLARARAADCVEEMAEQADRRPEAARIAGVKPSESVRQLRRAAREIRNISNPRAT